MTGSDVEYDFNPLSPCGERPINYLIGKGREIFQSTLPVWGETTRYPYGEPKLQISIHSPRVGRDPIVSSSPYRERYFNPLSPCGERR